MGAATVAASPVRSGELKGLISTLLANSGGDARRVRAIEHRASSAPSTFALEEVDVVVDDGELLRLILKVGGAAGAVAKARLSKPLFLHDPLREIEVYRHLLASRPQLDTAELHGTIVEPEHDRYWILLERAAGTELDRVESPAVWRAASRWLADMHIEFGGLVAYPSTPGLTRLLRSDSDFLRMWMTRALSIVRAQSTMLPDALRRGADRLALRYDRVIDRLLALPETVIHGEFHPANILVRRDDEGERFCVVDWEMAAIGPHLLDLAALVSGAPESLRHEVALAYREALPEEVQQMSSKEGFLEDLAFCRLHLAVQWLGLSPGESPPPYRVEAWLEELLDQAEELEI